MADQICGIYLGQETVHAVALQTDKKELRLTGGVLLPLREHVAAPGAGAILDPATEAGPAQPAAEEAEPETSGTAEEEIAALKAVVKALHLRQADAAIVLPKQQGILRSVLLPSTDDDELAQMARFETERHIPFHQERHESGYHIMRTLGVEGSEVLLGAVDGPIIDRAMQAVLASGLNAVGLTLSSVALVNALLYEHRAALTGKTVAVLNLGLDALDIVLLTEDRVRFARSLAMDLRGLLTQWNGAGEDAPPPPPERLALAAKTIDCMDLEAHYHPGESGMAASTEGPARVRGWISRLIQELRRTYDFARREMKCPPIEVMYLSGEGARMRNLDQYLKGNLNIEVIQLNPVAQLPGAETLKFPFDGLEFVLPLGAALGKLEPELYQLDLIPGEHYRHQARRHTLKRLGVTAGLLLGAIGLGVGAYARYSSINERIYADYANLNKKMQPVVAQLQEMKAKTDIIQNFRNDPNAALVILSAIEGSPTIPGSITLNTIEYAKGEAMTIQGDARTLPDINNLTDNLSAAKPKHFEDNSMEMTSDPGQLYNQPLYHFKITAKLTGSKEAKP